MTTVIEHCAIATVDAADTEYTDGHLVITGDRIAAVGPGPAPATCPTTAPRRAASTPQARSPPPG